jgi:hypothetical protein
VVVVVAGQRLEDKTVIVVAPVAGDNLEVTLVLVVQELQAKVTPVVVLRQQVEIIPLVEVEAPPQ